MTEQSPKPPVFATGGFKMFENLFGERRLAIIKIRKCQRGNKRGIG